MALDEKIVQELKEQLLNEKSDLEKNLSKTAKPIDKKRGDYKTTFDDLGNDMDENATEISEYSDNLAVENALEKRLQEIIIALEKIDKGTYGFCTNCKDKKEISIERLRANPAAQTCIECG
jgi:RNA polymerase-binding transcription factor DksA